MPQNRDEETELEKTQAEAQAAVPEGDAADGDLDLEGLDLTVEVVEERISPSETNVFDK